MDARDENRFSSLLKIQLFLNANLASFIDVPQIGNEKLVLDGYIQGIIINNGIAMNDTTGAREGKADARLAMTESTMRVARGLKALAVDLGDKLLLRGVDLTKSELNKMRDTEVHHACQLLLDTATPHTVALAGYRILPAHFTVLTTNITTYFATIAQPGKETDMKVIANHNVQEFLASSFTMLKTKMDVYMDLYLEDFPDLIEEYYLARAIDDMTGGSGGSGGGSTPVVFTGTVASSSSVVAGPFTYAIGAPVVVRNTSASISLTFQASLSGAVVGTPFIIAAGGEETGTLGEVAPNFDSFLVTNSTAVDGSYEITVG